MLSKNQRSYISDTIFAAGDVLYDPLNIDDPSYYMGDIYSILMVISTMLDMLSHSTILQKVIAYSNRAQLLRTEWISEFFNTLQTLSATVSPNADPGQEEGFACYSFVPKSSVPVKVIVLDVTQSETDGDPSTVYHGFLDQKRYDWLKNELAAGDASGQLMIIAAHIPIGVQPDGSHMEWWTNPQNAVTR